MSLTPFPLFPFLLFLLFLPIYALLPNLGNSATMPTFQNGIQERRFADSGLPCTERGTYACVSWNPFVYLWCDGGKYWTVKCQYYQMCDYNEGWC